MRPVLSLLSYMHSCAICALTLIVAAYVLLSDPVLGTLQFVLVCAICGSGCLSLLSAYLVSDTRSVR